MANQTSNGSTKSGTAKASSKKFTGTQGGTPEQHRQAGMQSHSGSTTKRDQ